MIEKVVVVTRRLRDEDVVSRVERIPTDGSVDHEESFAKSVMEQEAQSICRQFAEFNSATWKYSIQTLY